MEKNLLYIASLWKQDCLNKQYEYIMVFLRERFIARHSTSTLIKKLPVNLVNCFIFTSITGQPPIVISYFLKFQNNIF